jgi:hypothetical protein
MKIKVGLLLMVFGCWAFSLQASPMPPGAQCKTRVKVVECKDVQRSHPMAIRDFTVNQCQVLVLDEPELIQKGMQGEGCDQKVGDIVKWVVISGGFKDQPKGQKDEIIEGVLETAGDESGVWVNLSPIR